TRSIRHRVVSARFLPDPEDRRYDVFFTGITFSCLRERRRQVSRRKNDRLHVKQDIVRQFIGLLRDFHFARWRFRGRRLREKGRDRREQDRDRVSNSSWF